ncbi:MAG: hypothetical protein E4H16_02660, partial [Candidatus Atribacteria bacterium]
MKRSFFVFCGKEGLVMNIQEKFKYIPLPPVHNENKTKRYLDPFRKRLVPITQEETVRQRTACFFRDTLKTPETQIVLEEHLSHYQADNKERADIVIKYGTGNYGNILAVIECKSERVGLCDQTLEQVFRYADKLNAKYAFVCDGIEMNGYFYEEETNTYLSLKGIPTYKKMLSDGHTTACIHEPIFQRPAHDQLFALQEIDGEIIGEDTPRGIWPFIRNLAYTLLDGSHVMQPTKVNDISILQDLGLSYRRYGDASGSDFGTGVYRMILTKDDSGESLIYGFSILAVGKTTNDPKHGNLNGKSVLVVIASGERKDNMIVQINLNRFLTEAGDGFSISHNGKVAMKYANMDEFLEWIQKESPDLLESNT